MILSRASLLFSLQNWLAETPEQSRKAGTPAYVGVGMSGKTPIFSEPSGINTKLLCRVVMAISVVRITL